MTPYHATLKALEARVGAALWAYQNASVVEAPRLYRVWQSAERALWAHIDAGAPNHDTPDTGEYLPLVGDDR